MIKLKNIYNIGVFEEKEKEHKKIRLLNAFCITWCISVFFFLIMDSFLDKATIQTVTLHSLTLLIIIGIFLLQKNKQYTLARMMFITTIIALTAVFVNISSTAQMMEIYYFIYPLISIVLIDEKWFSISVLFVCYLLYNYSLIFNTGFYADGLINPVTSLTVFIGSFIVLSYSQALNKKSELTLGEKEETLQLAYKKLEKAKEHEVAHLQLKSLRAQMNPHFMFNAMNSIQSLILKGDKHDAYSYLTKFSSLIRDNLNMSEKSFVDFDEELSLLEKYLELEALRFKENFKYEIIGANEIGAIKIPSMIIQPFIENAIKHGLLHKIEGVKKIKIEFYMEEVFKCVVTDNGIGLKASEVINKANYNKEISFSTKAIQDRLVLLKNYYNADIGVLYEKVPIGTKVIIKIPYAVFDS